jgi:hypothetical protein
VKFFLDTANLDEIREATSKVVEQLFKQPLTDRGQEQFLKDWEKAKSS